MLHGELSYRIIGCAQRVHGELGPGLPESVYQRALSTELVAQKIPFEAEARFPVAYKGTLCGEFRVDLCVDEKVIVELKAVEALCDQHEAQLLTYPRAGGLRVGLLLNFGQPRLAVKRMVL